MGIFSKIFSKSKMPSSRELARYEQEKQAARSGSDRERLKLAKNPKTSQAILYYLAQQDANVEVRRAVAENSATPLQASALLAVDADQDVRMALAERLLRLLPDLDEGRQAQLYAFAVQALGTLALDKVIVIRKALSSALKDYAQAPPQVAAQLARDIEREVAEPILRYCVALADADLLDILGQHKESWALQAIAGRSTVSAAVTRGLIARDDRAAGEILLQNKGAVFESDVLAAVVEKAKHYTEWQRPLAVNAQLPAEMARKLAEFAAVSVRELLAKRADFDPRTQEEITAVFHRRLAYAEVLASPEAETPDAITARVEALVRAGKLNEDAVADALGMRDRAFAVAALARLAGTNAAMVEKILTLKAPKPIVSLSRRAGLSMRMALQLQKEIAQVKTSELIYPRGGTDYPFADEEMRKQLEFLGLK